MFPWIHAHHLINTWRVSLLPHRISEVWMQTNTRKNMLQDTRGHGRECGGCGGSVGGSQAKKKKQPKKSHDWREPMAMIPITWPPGLFWHSVSPLPGEREMGGSQQNNPSFIKSGSNHKGKKQNKKQMQVTFSTKGINCWCSANVFNNSIMNGR